jgi:hypothetical protein
MKAFVQQSISSADQDAEFALDLALSSHTSIHCANKSRCEPSSRRSYACGGGSQVGMSRGPCKMSVSKDAQLDFSEWRGTV